MSLAINIIGAGHLGKTLAYLFARQSGLSIQAICNRSQASTQAAIDFIGSGTYCPSIRELPAAALTLITTPDDMIEEACVALAHNPALQAGSIVLHCSGSLSSAALTAVAAKGCLVASVHPMRSFAQPELSVGQYQGTYCAIEGDAQALPLINELFKQIGSLTYVIDKKNKAIYHVAGVFASNYLITLAQQALNCMRAAEIDDEIALPIIANLMQGSLSNLRQTQSPARALTGLLKRGDKATIKKHLAAMQDDEQRSLYASLGQASLALTEHGVEEKAELQALLSSAAKAQ